EPEANSLKHARVVQRLRLARQARRLSTRQLAELCAQAGMPSLTRSTIAKIESGVRRSLTVNEAAVLAKVLGVPLTDLLDEEERRFLRTSDNSENLPAQNGTLPRFPMH